MAESKHDKFVRLRNARLERTAHAVRLIGNLANTYTYEYTRGEAEGIVNVLRSAARDVADAFGVTTMTGVVPLDQSYARWALDELNRGDTKQAKAYLKIAIQGGDQ